MQRNNNYFNVSKLKGLAIILLIGIFISCEKEDDIDGVNADAGENLTASTNDTVYLSGENSSLGESITYNWIFTSKPEGSNSILQNPTTATPHFIPDLAGEYMIQLTVSTGTENDADEISVIVEQGQSSTIEFSGDISTDTRWTNHVATPGIPDYLITSNVYLNAELTIEPGVLIHVKEDNAFVVNKEGSIVSEGASGEEIEFTSANEEGEIHWKGIFVKSNFATNILAYTIVKYAGNTEFNFSGPNYATAIGIEDGKLSVKNTRVINSKGYGFFFHSGDIMEFSQNSFSQNQDYGIRINAAQAAKIDNETTFSDPGLAVLIYESTLEESAETNWPDLNADARYYVEDWININSYLSISPGAIFDFAEDKAIKVNSPGTFVADAAGSEKIVFTSKNIQAGLYWKGIWVKSNDSRNTLDNVEISYAGNSEWSFSGSDHAAAVALEDGKISLENSTVKNSKNHGLYLHSGGMLLQFSSNSFMDNQDQAVKLMSDEVKSIDEATTFHGNGWDGVTIYNSAINEDAEWVDLNGSAKYKFEGWVDIHSGLTITAGAELVFDQEVALVVKNTGYLSAKGTSGNEITFTSSNETVPILWGGIWIQSSDGRNELDHVSVKYAGGYEFGFSGANYAAALAGDDADSPNLTLTNSSVTNSGSYAIYWEGGTINDVESVSANNEFINNAEAMDVVIP